MRITSVLCEGVERQDGGPEVRPPPEGAGEDAQGDRIVSAAFLIYSCQL
jgi:hypothetical protein